MPLWPTINKKTPIIQKEFRGVNRLDAFSILDSFASETKNLTSSNFPALTVRPGYTMLMQPYGNKVLGLGVWKDIELHAVFNDGTWRKWNGTEWVELYTGLDLFS